MINSSLHLITFKGHSRLRNPADCQDNPKKTVKDYLTRQETEAQRDQMIYSRSHRCGIMPELEQNLLMLNTPIHTSGDPEWTWRLGAQNDRGVDSPTPGTSLFSLLSQRCRCVTHHLPKDQIFLKFPRNSRTSGPGNGPHTANCTAELPGVRGAAEMLAQPVGTLPAISAGEGCQV